MSTGLGKLRSRVRGAFIGTVGGLALALGAVLSLLLFSLTGAVVVLVPLGLGAVVLPLLMPGIRRACDLERKFATRCGVPVASPYRDSPAVFEKDIVGWTRRCKWILTDPATWRDLLWLALNAVIGLTGLIPVVWLYYVLLGAAQATRLWKPAADHWYSPIVVQGTATAVLVGVLAVASFAAWLWVVPLILQVNARCARLLLGPARHAGEPSLGKTFGDWLGEFRARVAGAGRATVIGMVIAVGSEICLLLFLVTGYVMALFVIGLGLLLLPVTMRAVRWACDAGRRLAEWSGIPVGVPYLPEPDGLEDGVVGLMSRVKWILTDPATWRDLLWLLLNAVVGLVGLLPGVVFYYVGEGLVLAGGLWKPIMETGNPRWYGPIRVESQTAAVLAGLLAVLLFSGWLWLSPLVLKTHARFTALLLRPTGRALLIARARHLAETRADAIDIQAAELRRIERDLHDGAQARLVGMGMTLGAIERQLERNPDEARKLLVEARASSVSALNELRDLVHGIHPPVLAERGLPDALRALGMASPLEVDVLVSLAGQPPKPVESALYFAVSELLTNTLKHAEAETVEIAAWHENDVLYVRITDDGNGGAETGTGTGTGLHGIRRRLATFDGTLTVSSPPGGPTIAKMEVPCALSSPKTSSS